LRFALLGLLLLANAALAQMYKCVDERGVTHYADKPSPGCKGAQVDIRGQPPISGKLAPPGQNASREEREFRRRQIERERGETKDKQAQLARKRQCERLKNEYLRYDGARRIVTGVDAKGERVYMEDAERERRKARLLEELRACQ